MPFIILFADEKSCINIRRSKTI